MEFPYMSVIRLLKDNNCIKFGLYNSEEIWITQEGSTIRLIPLNAIHYDELEEIAISTIGMSVWEFDYWIGQNGPLN